MTPVNVSLNHSIVQGQTQFLEYKAHLLSQTIFNMSNILQDGRP